MKTDWGSNCEFYPLAWMIYNKILNNRIQRIHKRALRIVYREKISSFTEFQVIDTKLYEVKIAIAPDLIKKLFPLSMHAYNLRSSYEFDVENEKSIYYDTELSLYHF